MAGEDSDGRPPPQKRSRASANGEDAGAGSRKGRGRPRVDRQDETAADRRRTQIRLAQRAYRQRKETTISSLKEENTRLQSIIEQMNKSFLHFTDSAFKSGLSPGLAQELKHITETFVTLAKSASEGNQEEEEDVGEVAADPDTEMSNVAAHMGASGENRHAQAQQPPQLQLMDVGWGPSASLEEAGRQANATSPTREREKYGNFFPPMPNSPFAKTNQSSIVRLRRPISVGRAIDQSTSWVQTNADEDQSSQQLPFGLIEILSRQECSPGTDNPQIYSVNIPTPDTTPLATRLPTPTCLPNLSTKTLPPTWTYSHDETTFARRLARAALETGFHLLCAANQRPAAINYVFKLSLPYMSPNDLHERFKMLLARGTDEDLDCWETPFIHLGGAGTHYPRKDAQGNLVSMPNSWTVRRIGPISAKMMRAENSADPSQSHDLNIDLAGFEGEWFDAYDVEGYLEQEKGCRIDPKDSFAEVVIEEDEAFDTSEADDYFFANNTLKSNYSQPRRLSNTKSDTPGFSNGSNSTDTLSANSTSVNNSTSNSSIAAFAPSDAPFGVNIGINLTHNFPTTDFSKSNDIDPSTLFDQPLGLDLAPGFDMNANANTSMPSFNLPNEGIDIGALGLDLMGGERSPVVRQKKTKTAWIDVSKLVDEIIKHGVCLGRGPGFRRKDIDMAFEASLVKAF